MYTKFKSFFTDKTRSYKHDFIASAISLLFCDYTTYHKMPCYHKEDCAMPLKISICIEFHNGTVRLDSAIARISCWSLSMQLPVKK